jgi:hypothetical protein
MNSQYFHCITLLKLLNRDLLGVLMDSNLSWEIHIERTCSRIRPNLFIINRLSKILDLNERKTLYYGLICPLLSYGIAVWGHSAKANTTRIFALQKNALMTTAGLTFGIVQE